jgi:hypothetical protein
MEVNNEVKMMNKNEKAIISAKDYSLNTNQKSELSMRKYKSNTNTNQDNSPLGFVLPELPFPHPPKTLETINCFCCERKRDLDGYLFKLVPVCSDCRTERSLEILSNQIELRVRR